MGRLFVYFWDVCLGNLPRGRFQRRAAMPAEARVIILAARAGKVFQAASADDLLAPYQASERVGHEALCGVLRDSYDIDVGFEDFLCAAEPDGLQYILPLDLVRLAPDEALMVVGCSYTLGTDKGGSIEDRFAIGEGSVTFNVIEALPPASEAVDRIMQRKGGEPTRADDVIP
jgi:hypothetical protein